MEEVMRQQPDGTRRATAHRHPAHPVPVRREHAPVVIHVTVCVAGRKPLLANEESHLALVHAWCDASLWHVGEYLLMPDHIHLFCSPATFEGYPLRRWVGYWKRVAGQGCPALKHRFQEDCWDTQMRTLDQYNEKLSYVRNNPVRRALVANWQDWPFRGRIYPLAWL